MSPPLPPSRRPVDRLSRKAAMAVFARSCRSARAAARSGLAGSRVERSSDRMVEVEYIAMVFFQFEMARCLLPGCRP